MGPTATGLDQQSHIELPEKTSGLCESWCWTLRTYAKMNYLSDFGICNNSQCFLTMKITSCCWLFRAKLKIWHRIFIQCVQKKVSPPNIWHWQVQTYPVLNKIKHALAQKYLSYCCQISYDSIIPFNRFSIFTNCCHRFQLPTWLAYYARRTPLTSRMTHFVDKQNVVKRR